MPQLELLHGLILIFDEQDQAFVEGRKWWARKSDHTYYAMSPEYVEGRRRFIQLHRAILGVQPEQMVDHRNGNGLDNRRANLRIATNMQNQRNRGSHTGSSQYKGVCWDATHERWKAYITVNKKRITLGYSHNERKAAIMYDKAAIENFGEFARPNGVI